MAPLNVNLPIDRIPGQGGHTTGHNLANEAVNRTAAAVDALAEPARTGRLSDALDVNTSAASLGQIVAVSLVADGRPSFDLVDPPEQVVPDPPDATGLTKGVARLLGGTADAPSVPWSAVTGRPAIPAVPGDIGAQPAGSYATSGDLTAGLAAKADTSALTAGLAAKSDLGHTHAGGSGVTSVNGASGVVVLTADSLTDGSTQVMMTSAERTKLAAVAPAATANSTDAALRDRATHTGAQAISTVTGLQAALDGKAAAVTTGAKLWVGTQAAYDAIVTKDATTLYAITG